MSGPTIRLDSVGKIFGEGAKAFVALEDLTLDIRPGEFLAIVGPSGPGKTTVLNMLAGLETPTSGVIRLDDRRIDGPGPDRGVMFQDYALFPWLTVRGNVGFGLAHGPAGAGLDRREREERVARVIELVNLRGAEDRYPHQLSGGMRQRVALARLIANEPETLLMDEPLAALDAQTRLVLQDEILRIWRQDQPPDVRRTAVFITHGIDEAVYLADRVVVLGSRPGRLKAIVDVPLPRPRGEETRTSAEFADLCRAIWDLIREEAIRATVE
jgi:NitT/TauT family transport system ATP-binding protein